jgi:hypothetical protein
MTDWEFLIQREGDRGWRPIETGNLQLKEGKYRIVANSQLINTQIQTRITHQTPGLSKPQRKSRSCRQTSNATGLVVIIPFTHLQSGIWQFVCSGKNPTQTPWQRILKLRVLPRTPIPPTVPAATLDPLTAPSPPIEIEPTTLPTAPLAPISMLGERENWADSIDAHAEQLRQRLLARLERESLQTPAPQPTDRPPLPGVIQLSTVFESPSQLISLNKSTFSGIIPGNRLTIAGKCNLQLLNASLVKPKIEKLSICLRHPQTSEIIISIEQSLPPNLDVFGFRGQVDLPLTPKVGLLLGEVNLYDKHHIQLGSSGFTVGLDLNPLHESESLFQIFDDDNDDLVLMMAQLTHDLNVESLAIAADSVSPRLARSAVLSVIPPLNSRQAPPAGHDARSTDSFTHPDIIPVEPFPTNHIFSQAAVRNASSQQPSPAHPLAEDLEIDFGYPTLDLSPAARNYPNLEIVIDD